jgi:hypothetical protein
MEGQDCTIEEEEEEEASNVFVYSYVDSLNYILPDKFNFGVFQSQVIRTLIKKKKQVRKFMHSVTHLTCSYPTICHRHCQIDWESVLDKKYFFFRTFNQKQFCSTSSLLHCYTNKTSDHPLRLTRSCSLLSIM